MNLIFTKTPNRTLQLMLLLAIISIVGSPIKAKAHENDSKPGFFSIMNGAGKCLDVSDSEQKVRGRVQVWDCNNSRNQLWYHDTYGRLVHASGLCLDVLSGNFTDGQSVILYDCHGARNELWDGVEFLQWGRYESGRTGHCLDVHWPERYMNGGRVQIWTCLNGENQQWLAGPDHTINYGSYTVTLKDETEDNCGSTVYLQRSRNMPLIELPRGEGNSVIFPVGDIRRGNEIVIPWGCGHGDVSHDRTRCPNGTNEVYMKRVDNGREFETKCRRVLLSYP